MLWRVSPDRATWRPSVRIVAWSGDTRHNVRLLPLHRKKVVIPECLCRESTPSPGFPTEAFGNDDLFLDDRIFLNGLKQVNQLAHIKSRAHPLTDAPGLQLTGQPNS